MSDSAHREWRFYLDDMIAFAEKVLAYTDGFDQTSFVASRINYDATLRNLELIGEATFRTRCARPIRKFHGGSSSPHAIGSFTLISALMTIRYGASSAAMFHHCFVNCEPSKGEWHEREAETRIDLDQKGTSVAICRRGFTTVLTTTVLETLSSAIARWVNAMRCAHAT